MSTTQPITKDQAADYFDGQPIPSALPTLADVARFMDHWHGQICFIGQQASPKPYAASLMFHFHNIAGVPELKVTASYYGNDARATEYTPEAAIAALEREIGPAAKAARAAELRRQADELEGKEVA